MSLVSSPTTVEGPYIPDLSATATIHCQRVPLSYTVVDVDGLGGVIVKFQVRGSAS